MKNRNTVFLLVSLFLLSGADAIAQSWLDKVANTIDKVDKQIQAVEEALQSPTDEAATKTPATEEVAEDETEVNDGSQYHFVQAFKNIETYTDDVQFPVKFISCIRNGENVTIEFEIGNATNADLKMGGFGGGTRGFQQREASSIVDNTGNNHSIYSATIGGKSKVNYNNGVGYFEIHQGTKVKGSINIRGVSKSATSFQAIKMAYHNNQRGSYTTLYFTFKNVPILSVAEIAKLEQEYKQKEFQKLVAKANAGNADAQYRVGAIYYQNGDYAKAIDYYVKSADQGHADAQGEMAYLYLYGNGSPDRDRIKDHTKALPYAQKSAGKGNVKAHFVLGVLYLNGEVIEKSENKEIEHLTYAANRELVDAQLWLGQKYMGVDPTLSAQWYRKAADNGVLTAICRTGVNYFYGKGIESDKEKALEYFLKGVEENDKECLYYAGRMYRRGEGCYKDLTQAEKMLLKSAEQGSVDGQRELAYYYQDDERDYLKAVDYFTRAIEQGDTSSLYYLAEMYEKGTGVLKNPSKAKELYARSAEGGNRDSQYKLGMMAKEKNINKEAFNWFSKSAEAGLSDAQYEVGLMYFYAKGTTKSNKKAAQYIKKAHEQNHKEAAAVWNKLQLWKYL